MKKIFSVLVFIFSLICGILICGCADTAPTDSEEHYFIVTYSAKEGGYIDGQAEQQLESGKDGLTVVAVPYDGYEFVKWSDGRTEATRQDINVTVDISVTAEFKVKVAEQAKEYTVTYQANEGGAINGNAYQTVKDGENGTEVTAVPNEGYKFVKWSDGKTEAARQDKNVTADISVVANFEKLTYKLSYVADRRLFAWQCKSNGCIRRKRNQSYGNTERRL